MVDEPGRTGFDRSPGAVSGRLDGQDVRCRRCGHHGIGEEGSALQVSWSASSGPSPSRIATQHRSGDLPRWPPPHPRPPRSSAQFRKTPAPRTPVRRLERHLQDQVTLRVGFEDAAGGTRSRIVGRQSDLCAEAARSKARTVRIVSATSAPVRPDVLERGRSDRTRDTGERPPRQRATRTPST